MTSVEREFRNIKPKGCHHGVVSHGKSECPRCLAEVRHFWRVYDAEERRMGRALPKCPAPPL